MKISKFLQESITVRLISTAARLERTMNLFLKVHELSALQSLILISIFIEDGNETRHKHLYATFRTTKGNISHCLTRLEELKLLKRAHEVSDRRGSVIRLTKKGETTSKALVGYFHELENLLETSLLPTTALEFNSLLRTMSRSQHKSVVKIANEVTDSSI